MSGLFNLCQLSTYKGAAINSCRVYASLLSIRQTSDTYIPTGDVAENSLISDYSEDLMSILSVVHETGPKFLTLALRVKSLAFRVKSLMLALRVESLLTTLLSLCNVPLIHVMTNGTRFTFYCMLCFAIFRWDWRDWGLLQITYHYPSVLWHCWLSHPACKNYGLRNDL